MMYKKDKKMMDKMMKKLPTGVKKVSIKKTTVTGKKKKMM